MSVKLGFNTHGKGRVRVVKVIKKPDGVNYISQINVQVLLEGDIMDDAFTDGNNRNIVATDTCKNTIYCLAGSHDFKSIEDFGIIVVW
jgi:urate oxidase